MQKIRFKTIRILSMLAKDAEFLIHRADCEKYDVKVIVKNAFENVGKFQPCFNY
jgi:hypothetical protein